MSGGPAAERRRYRSLFCGFLWPRHPGRSGGEIRDFHLVRHILGLSALEFFALQAEGAVEADLLRPRLEALHLPECVPAPPLAERAALLLQRWGVVAGGALHSDAAHKLAAVRSLAPRLQAALDRGTDDFLFVSPQVNPVARIVDARRSRARLILATYDVEAVRVRRLAEAESGMRRRGLLLDAGRAERFERDYLSRFDGVIAVSELDREIFIARYGLPPDRVLAIENGVDPAYFAFQPREERRPPEVVFVGALGYPPNAQAARRLATSMLPLVRRSVPGCRLLLVGQGPGASLRALDDGRSTIVTGAVDDVRPFLGRASAACIPLTSGSGTKYKLLEALSAGVPVACSPLAAEGLAIEDGRHVLVAGTDEEMAAVLCRLILDPSLARRLAEEGRRLVESRYAWDANLPRLGPWLDGIARQPVRRRA